MLQSYPSYAPLLILGGIAIGFAAFTLVVSQLLGRPRPNPAKSAVYECGVPAIGSARALFPRDACTSRTAHGAPADANVARTMSPP